MNNSGIHTKGSSPVLLNLCTAARFPPSRWFKHFRDSPLEQNTEALMGRSACYKSDPRLTKQLKHEITYTCLDSSHQCHIVFHQLSHDIEVSLRLILVQHFNLLLCLCQLWQSSWQCCMLFNISQHGCTFGKSSCVQAQLWKTCSVFQWTILLLSASIMPTNVPSLWRALENSHAINI